MGYVEKHHGKYRARSRDASGRVRSKSFTLKADAERWVREEGPVLRSDWPRRVNSDRQIVHASFGTGS